MNISSPQNFIIVVAFAIPLFYTIETYAWIYKKKVSFRGVGYAVSSSNKFLYASRFLLVAVSIIVSIFLENNGSKENLSLYLYISILLTFLSHLVLKNRCQVSFFNNKFGIFHATSLSTCIFVLSLLLPWVIFEKIYQYRMTAVYLTQALNAAGTFMLLYWVDPYLYKELDKGSTGCVNSHIAGRCLGFLIALCAVASIDLLV